MSTFGARPVLLRCSRCGRFVDSAEARLQVICDCRPHLDLPPIALRDATPGERAVVLDLFRRDLGETRVVAFGEIVALDAVPCVVAFMKGELAGAVAYRAREGAVEILALATEPMWQRSGVGGHLLDRVEAIGRALGLARARVATTNDNLPALYFYQRRGYVLREALLGEMASRVGAGTGFSGIPVRDELRLEKRLDGDADA